jgi:hypothetical protein
VGAIIDAVERGQRRLRWRFASEGPAPRKVAQGERLPEPEPILDALLTADRWMVRRKDVVRFSTERELRRSHSFDFYVPDCVVKPFVPAPVLPLGFWWKASDRYFEIDFVDDDGRALPLHRTAYSKRLTLNVMLEHARRVLSYDSRGRLSRATYASITFIVEAEPAEAFSEFYVTWYVHRRRNCEISQLAKDAEFMRLLGVSAFASVVTTKVRGDLGRRHLVKLHYTERQKTYFRTDRYKLYKVPSKQKTRRVPRWIPRIFGLGAYELDLSNPFVRAQSYHFEAYAPQGLQFASASLKLAERLTGPESSKLEHSLHLEDRDMGSASFATLRSKLLVTDRWLTSAIICTAIAFGVLVGVSKNVESFEPSSSQNVIAAMLLLPSVAMAIVWRRVHWVVERLHKWIRYAFLSVSVLLFYLAFRIAESPTVNTSQMSLHLSGRPLVEFEEMSRFTDGQSLATTARLIMIYTAAVLAILLVVRFHRDRIRDIWRTLSRRD